MSDGEAITKPAPGSAHDASDESGAESDPEEVRSRLERYEEELRALRCPLPAAAELPAARYRLRDLLPRVLPALERYDTAFLTDYLAVLWRERPAEIERVTCDVMASIEDALRQQAGAEEDESCALGEQRVVLCAFLCAACLADTPRVRDARPALRQLLQGTSEKERELLAELWWRALPAAALMQLSDAVRAPRRAALHDAPSLAELLLRAALCRLPPDDNGSAPEVRPPPPPAAAPAACHYSPVRVCAVGAGRAQAGGPGARAGGVGAAAAVRAGAGRGARHAVRARAGRGAARAAPAADAPPRRRAPRAARRQARRRARRQEGRRVQAADPVRRGGQAQHPQAQDAPQAQSQETIMTALSLCPAPNKLSHRELPAHHRLQGNWYLPTHPLC